PARAPPPPPPPPRMPPRPPPAPPPAPAPARHAPPHHPPVPPGSARTAARSHPRRGHAFPAHPPSGDCPRKRPAAAPHCSRAPPVPPPSCRPRLHQHALPELLAEAVPRAPGRGTRRPARLLTTPP